MALSKGGCWDRALAMFDEMRRSSIVRPDASSYTTMLRVCEKAGYWEQVIEDEGRETYKMVGLKPPFLTFPPLSFVF